MGMDQEPSIYTSKNLVDPHEILRALIGKHRSDKRADGFLKNLNT